MGDRGNVQFAGLNGSDGKVINLYSHWGGGELPRMVRDALATERARSREGDFNYLTRIIVTSIIHDNEGCMGETGWGLGFEPDDNSYPILTVNVAAETVEYNGRTFAFSEFRNLSDSAVDDMGSGT